VRILRKARVVRLAQGAAEVEVDGHSRSVPMDAAFVLIGSEPPVAFLRKLGVRFEGSWAPARLFHLTWVLGLVYSIYGIKNGLWPFEGVYAGLHAVRLDPGLLYGLLYSFLMTFFGLKALARYRQDPYQRKRYGTLIAAQWIVYFALPWALWYGLSYPEYWRAWGVALVYPLGYYALWEPAAKLVSDSVLPWTVGSVLAFAVFMPIFCAFHGKRFCAWFCPCGGLADTVGDAWRHKAPRGKAVRTLEISSSVIMWITLAGSVYLISGYQDFVSPARFQAGYKWVVDIGLASIVAISLYPFSGGRIWCRFFCPLAKYMELLGRWTGGRLAIVPNDECISCGECTRYCQMGIDVRAFAQRQWPLSNSTTSCIFCGICVTVCPVDVLRVERVSGGTRRLEPLGPVARGAGWRTRDGGSHGD
jgi:ferredoxin